MKVLWFTNTPSLAENSKNTKRVDGGWIKSLEKEIMNSNDIELAIAFYSNQQIDEFRQSNTKYYPIPIRDSSTRLNNLIKRMNAEVEPESDIEKFVRIVNDFQPSLIHIMGTEKPFGLIQDKIKNIPIVISIQGNFTVYNEKYFSGLPKNYVKKQTLFKSKVLFKSYIDIYNRFQKKVLREQKILKSAKYIIGRTDWDRRITRVLAPDSIYFHNDEILRKSFYQYSWNNKLKNELILFTTTGTNLYKGLETILKSAIELDNLNINYKWLIAGISLHDQIVNLIIKSFHIEVSKNIIFLDKLSEKDIVKHLLNVNIYVMASHIENSPNNLCEAMILGLPCIATDVGGTSSLLTNKVEGILIQDGDAFSLTGSILEMYNKYDKAIKYGQKARTRALKRHDPKDIKCDLLNIYNSVIDEF